MLSVHERAQLVAAARLYYESNLTQAQIAQRLNVSRPSVSKMLARARELGIVHIEIRAGDEGKADLLQRLQAKYALAGGCVLTEEQDVLTQAMHYLMAETTADKSLALGWGYALGEVVLKAADCSSYTQDGMVYPLIGTANFPNKGYHPDELVKIWASACGRSCYMLGCSAFPCSEEERAELESRSVYQQLLQQWQSLDAAVVSICGYPAVPDEATATRFGDALEQQKAVGSFLSYYYNQRGEFISGNNDYCMHIPLAQLRRCKKLIGIGLNAGNKALLGALATGLFTHLIISEEQAKELLK